MKVKLLACATLIFGGVFTQGCICTLTRNAHVRQKLASKKVLKAVKLKDEGVGVGADLSKPISAWEAAMSDPKGHGWALAADAAIIWGVSELMKQAGDDTRVIIQDNTGPLYYMGRDGTVTIKQTDSSDTQK